MAQSTTNLGKIHVFPSETLYNQFKNLVADNDLALLKDDGEYIIAANLAQNGYVKFSNGLILQWGVATSTTINFHLTFSLAWTAFHICTSSDWTRIVKLTNESMRVSQSNGYWFAIGI